MSYQQIRIVGNLTREPETKVSKNEKPYTAISVAVNEYQGSGQEDKVTFFTCRIFNGSGKSFREHMWAHTGALVDITGPESVGLFIRSNGMPGISRDILVNEWHILRRGNTQPATPAPVVVAEDLSEDEFSDVPSL